jgi:hypothetical protein
MTPATPPVLYISADTSDLTTRYKATPRMHMGADAWIPRDAVRVKPLEFDGIAGSVSAKSAIGEYVVEEHANMWGCWTPEQPDGCDPEGWLPRFPPRTRENRRRGSDAQGHS